MDLKRGSHGMLEKWLLQTNFCAMPTQKEVKGLREKTAVVVTNQVQLTMES